MLELHKIHLYVNGASRYTNTREAIQITQQGKLSTILPNILSYGSPTG